MNKYVVIDMILDILRSNDKTNDLDINIDQHDNIIEVSLTNNKYRISIKRMFDLKFLEYYYKPHSSVKCVINEMISLLDGVIDRLKKEGQCDD